MKKIAISLFAIAFFSPLLASAAVDCPAGAPLCNVQQVIDLIVAIVNNMQVIFWVVAAGSGLYAAFLYMRSSGSSEMLKKAQNQFVYTVIAVALAVIAFGLPAIIDSFLRIGQ